VGGDVAAEVRDRGDVATLLDDRGDERVAEHLADPCDVAPAPGTGQAFRRSRPTYMTTVKSTVASIRPLMRIVRV
jgi:hypothetical protein